jgi:hypothetical protein
MSAARRPSSTSYLLVLCGLVLAATSVMRDWFSQGPVSAGLWGIDCSGNACHSARWDDVGGTDFDIVVAGYLGTVAALLAGVLMLVCGVLAAGSSGERGPVRHARMMAYVAIAAIAWFMLRLQMDGHLGLDWAAVAGPIAAIGGALMLRRL